MKTLSLVLLTLAIVQTNSQAMSLTVNGGAIKPTEMSWNTWTNIYGKDGDVSYLTCGHATAQANPSDPIIALESDETTFIPSKHQALLIHCERNPIDAKGLDF
jgi:hypothetical protein